MWRLDSRLGYLNGGCVLTFRWVQRKEGDGGEETRRSLKSDLLLLKKD